MISIPRTLLAAAAAIVLAGPPAAAQTAPAGHDLIQTSLETILVVCASAVRDKFDFNDATALARYGLAPLDDNSEARMRENGPAVEAAGARFPEAEMLVSYTPGGNCMTLISGDGQVAVRERLVSELVSHGFRNERFDFPGYQAQVFDFGAATITIKTTRGTNSIAVFVKLKD